MRRLRELTEREGHVTTGSDEATMGHSAAFVRGESGRATRRERVQIPGAAGSIKKNTEIP